MTVRLLGALAALVLVLGGCSSPTPAKKQASDRLPDITLAALDGGKRLDLASLKGPAVINLWASWCVPCKRELPKYQAFSEKYAGKVDVIGVDFQETRPDGRPRADPADRRDVPALLRPGRTAPRRGSCPRSSSWTRKGRIAHEMYVEITSVAQLEKLVDQHLGVTS